MQKVAIIGGGASGIVAAIQASKSGANVEIFEKNSTLGKKIAIAGNGKCNISNTEISAQNYYCKDPSFVNAIINTVNFKALQKLFLDFGIVFTQNSGQVFPHSKDGKNVLSLLQNRLVDNGVKIHHNCEITAVKKTSNFTLFSADKTFSGYDKVMLCSGSNAYIKHPTRDSYFLAKDLGLQVQDAFASLVQVNLKQHHHKIASGVKVNAKVTLQLDGTTHQCCGDLLFTPYGLSGLSILDLSYRIATAKQKGKKVVLNVDLFQQKPLLELEEFLKTLYQKSKPQELELFLKSLFPSKLVTMLMQKYNLDQTINPKVIKKLCYIFKEIEFEVDSTRELKYAEVAGGGVSVEEVDKQTLMSKKIPNLYLGGEVLDVVGQRGGYNLHFALACGVICGKSLVG